MLLKLSIISNRTQIKAFYFLCSCRFLKFMCAEWRVVRRGKDCGLARLIWGSPRTESAVTPEHQPTGSDWECKWLAEVMMFPLLHQTTSNIPEITINTSLCLFSSRYFSKTFPESAESATQEVVGAEQWETLKVHWDKQSAYSCLHLDAQQQQWDNSSNSHSCVLWRKAVGVRDSSSLQGILLSTIGGVRGALFVGRSGCWCYVDATGDVVSLTGERGLVIGLHWSDDEGLKVDRSPELTSCVEWTMVKHCGISEGLRLSEFWIDNLSYYCNWTAMSRALYLICGSVCIYVCVYVWRTVFPYYVCSRWAAAAACAGTW